eukprot:1702167-Alexandrium_andersonii.AAC.1
MTCGSAQATRRRGSCAGRARARSAERRTAGRASAGCGAPPPTLAASSAGKACAACSVSAACGAPARSRGGGKGGTERK